MCILLYIGKIQSIYIAIYRKNTNQSGAKRDIYRKITLTKLYIVTIYRKNTTYLPGKNKKEKEVYIPIYIENTIQIYL